MPGSSDNDSIEVQMRKTIINWLWEHAIKHNMRDLINVFRTLPNFEIPSLRNLDVLLLTAACQIVEENLENNCADVDSVKLLKQLLVGAIREHSQHRFPLNDLMKLYAHVEYLLNLFSVENGFLKNADVIQHFGDIQKRWKVDKEDLKLTNNSYKETLILFYKTMNAFAKKPNRTASKNWKNERTEIITAMLLGLVEFLEMTRPLLPSAVEKIMEEDLPRSHDTPMNTFIQSVKKDSSEKALLDLLFDQICAINTWNSSLCNEVVEDMGGYYDECSDEDVIEVKPSSPSLLEGIPPQKNSSCTNLSDSVCRNYNIMDSRLQNMLEDYVKSTSEYPNLDYFVRRTSDLQQNMKKLYNNDKTCKRKRNFVSVEGLDDIVPADSTDINPSVEKYLKNGETESNWSALTRSEASYCGPHSIPVCTLPSDHTDKSVLIHTKHRETSVDDDIIIRDSDSDAETVELDYTTYRFNTSIENDDKTEENESSIPLEQILEELSSSLDNYESGAKCKKSPHRRKNLRMSDSDVTESTEDVPDLKNFKWLSQEKQTKICEVKLYPKKVSGVTIFS